MTRDDAPQKEDEGAEEGDPEPRESRGVEKAEDLEETPAEHQSPGEDPQPRAELAGAE